MHETRTKALYEVKINKRYTALGFGFEKREHSARNHIKRERFHKRCKTNAHVATSQGFVLVFEKIVFWDAMDAPLVPRRGLVPNKRTRKRRKTDAVPRGGLAQNTSACIN